jgi:carbonic anhydrase
MKLNRAAFLVGSLAAMSAALPERARGAAPHGPGVDPHEGLARLMAGNKRFVANDFPPLNQLVQKRARLTESQAPFAAILGCSDSRVIPELVFTQGIGELFVCRVAGNYPDDVVIGSIEYAVEHLGTRLIMVLGHQGCGAVKAVYSAIETNTPLPTHLSSIERLMAPGIEGVVHAHGSAMAAVEANVRAAMAKLRTTPPVLSKGVGSGHLLVAGGVYELASGKVTLIE